jgi:heme oxygenase
MHADLERLVERQGFFSSPAGYGEYLRHLHLFYRNFLARLAGNAGHWVAAWQVPERIEWLAKDLESLALEPLPGNASLTSTFERLEDRARVLGALYVLLGASLGSRVLIERTRNFLLPARGGQLYLTSVGLHARWNSFLDTLEQERVPSNDRLCQGAIETFASIRDHLAMARAS